MRNSAHGRSKATSLVTDRAAAAYEKGTLFFSFVPATNASSASRKAKTSARHIAHEKLRAWNVFCVVHLFARRSRDFFRHYISTTAMTKARKEDWVRVGQLRFRFLLSVARTMGQRTVCEKRTCRGGFEKCAGRGRGRTRTRERARGCARAARARRARRGRRPRPGSRTRGPAGRGWRRGQTARTARRLAERLPAGKRGVGGERASTHLRVGIVPRREHIRGHAEKRAARRGVGHRESDALRSARGIAFFGRHC